MPRENSFSDSDGRSLTPDLSEDEDRREREEELDLPPLPTSFGKQPARPVAAPIQTDVSTGAGPSSRYSAVPRSPGSSAKSPASLLSARKSIHNRFTHFGHSQAPTPPLRYTTPKERFRAAVQKVMAIRRTSRLMSSGGAIGAEPGIDPRRNSAYTNYGHIRQKCLIDIVDYSPLRTSFGRMTNNEFVHLLEDDTASQRDPWVKVRWINVGGISWDVISVLAIKYDMHPLALEDVLHQRGHARSKADYYHQHLFLRVLCHTLGSAPTQDPVLGNSAPSQSPSRTLTNLPRSASPVPLDEKLGIADVDAEDAGDGYGDGDGLRDDDMDLESGLGKRPSSLLAKKRKRAAAELTLDQLKKGERVNVRIAPMCIFLYRDGTVISFHPDTSLDFTAPIANRIRQRDTTLRMTADPSLLVESLLDLVVDSALEVVDEYHARINKLERNVLIKPKVKTVRDLHILSGDLILHKRTMGPIKTMVYGLRRYDLDRCAALVDASKATDAKITGYMSHKSKIYLADVHDHMEYILTSLDMYADMAENLINYTFNMASYEMNEVMRQLTLATIIFLPLTLLTGYFGMNFEVMWTIQHGHSDVVFWAIALPVMAIVIPIFLRNDIQRMIHYVQKRLLVKRVKKGLKDD
ncbi:hypothetical protein OF83DRAFT_1168596 [Amylostereum chailletii]|nr:hypothetical protein OF83DRAFT_1168596 [Amylostereum chailletii]